MWFYGWPPNTQCRGSYMLRGRVSFPGWRHCNFHKAWRHSPAVYMISVRALNPSREWLVVTDVVWKTPNRCIKSQPSRVQTNKTADDNTTRGSYTTHLWKWAQKWQDRRVGQHQPTKLLSCHYQSVIGFHAFMLCLQCMKAEFSII